MVCVAQADVLELKNGKVLTGMTGCGRYGADCYISAYDARTGEPVWRFSTIAREGQSGGDTWGGLPNLLRAGGDTWIAGSARSEIWLVGQEVSPISSA